MSMKQYKILKNEHGDRFVQVGGQIIPADIAGLAVGKDKWLSQIKCKCRDCGELFTLSQLRGNGQWCEECQTAGIED